MSELSKPWLNLSVALTALIYQASAIAFESQLEKPDNLIVSQGLQVVVALGVTLATIWGLSRVALKKSWHRSFKQQQIKVLDSVALGSRERVILIELDDHQVLIGSTPGQLCALHSFEKTQKKNFEQALKDVQAEQTLAVAEGEASSELGDPDQQIKGVAQ